MRSSRQLDDAARLRAIQDELAARLRGALARGPGRLDLRLGAHLARRPDVRDRAHAAAVLGRAGFAIITAAGPGSWKRQPRRPHAGAVSIGLDIELPDEEFSIMYVDLGLDFHHFFARKVMFVRYASAFVVFPAARHPRRALRGRDAAPDGQDPASHHPVGLGLLDRPGRLDDRHDGGKGNISVDDAESLIVTDSVSEVLRVVQGADHAPGWAASPDGHGVTSARLVGRALELASSRRRSRTRVPRRRWPSSSASPAWARRGWWPSSPSGPRPRRPRAARRRRAARRGGGSPTRRSWARCGRSPATPTPCSRRWRRRPWRSWGRSSRHRRGAGAGRPARRAGALFEALLAVLDGLGRAAAAAGDRGPGLGGRLHPRLPPLVRRRVGPRAAAGRRDRRPDELHRRDPLGRCWPS